MIRSDEAVPIAVKLRIFLKAQMHNHGSLSPPWEGQGVGLLV
jgi:hypothetical protein